MLRVLASPRNFPDLPSKWDGSEIAWGAWEKRLRTSLDFIISPACEGCRSTTSLWEATGWWMRHHRIDLGCEWERRGMRNFHATRCGWCGRTTVFTMHDGQAWDLDETDYGPAGSLDPADAHTLF